MKVASWLGLCSSMLYTHMPEGADHLGDNECHDGRLAVGGCKAVIHVCFSMSEAERNPAKEGRERKGGGGGGG